MIGASSPQSLYAYDSSGNVIGLVSPAGAIIPLSGYVSDIFLDVVISGLTLPTSGASLTATIPSGVAYVAGLRVVKSGESITFTASRDNYVDLSYMGIYTVTTATIGAAAPALIANHIRLGIVTTGAGSITTPTRTGKDSLGNWMFNTVRTPSCILGGSSTQALSQNNLYQPCIFGTGLEVFDNNQMHSNTYPSQTNTTISLATPAVVSWASHGLVAGTPVVITANAPTGMVLNTVYYVSSGATLLANSFAVCSTYANAIAGTGQIATSGSTSTATIKVVTTRISITQTGIYQVNGEAITTATVTGLSQLGKNGAQLASFPAGYHVNGKSFSFSGLAYLAAGDYLELLMNPTGGVETITNAYLSASRVA